MHSLFFSTLHTYKLYIYIYSRSKLFIIIYCIYYMCAYIYIYMYIYIYTYTYTYICVHVSDDYKHVFYIVFAQMHHGLAKIRDWVLRCTVNQDYIYIYIFIFISISHAWARLEHTHQRRREALHVTWPSWGGRWRSVKPVTGYPNSWMVYNGESPKNG